MAQQYDNTNRGILFTNDRKRGPNDPDYTGSINVDGVERWLSAWNKEGRRGPFISLSIGKAKEPGEKRTAPAPSERRAASTAPANTQPEDDTIPF